MLTKQKNCTPKKFNDLHHCIIAAFKYTAHLIDTNIDKLKIEKINIMTNAIDSMKNQLHDQDPNKILIDFKNQMLNSKDNNGNSIILKNMTSETKKLFK